MGTTVEKLAYLKETKSQIRQALETPYNVMRDYPALIKKYIDNQPTQVVTDGNCLNALDVPLVSLSVDGQSEQETTTGRQLFKDIPTETKTGMTLTNNGDGTYTLNGTTTRATSFYLINIGYGSGTYALSLNNEATLPPNCYTQLETSNENKMLTFSPVNNKNIFECNDINTLSIVLGSGVTCNNFKFAPMLELGAEYHKVEKYTGGQPSPNPDYPQEVEVIDGVNLFDKDNVRAGYRLDSDGTYLACIGYSATELKRVEQNTTYQTSWQLQIMKCICTYDNNENFIRRILNDGYSFTTTSNEYYIRADVSDDLLETAQITKGTTPKPYLPYGCIGLRHSNEDGSKSEVIPINLNGNSIAKVGDIKDLLKIYRNGNVEIKKYIRNLKLAIKDMNNNEYYPGWQNVDYIKEDFPNWTGGVGGAISNIHNGSDTALVNTANNYKILYLYKEIYGLSQTQWKTQYPDLVFDLYYALKTSQTIQLPSIDPIQLWEGTNIFKLITNLDTTFEMEYVVNKDYIMNTLETQNLLNIVEGENI